VNALYRLRITDQLFKSYAFTRVVRSQSTLQLLRRQIKKKNTLYIKQKLISFEVSTFHRFLLVNDVLNYDSKRISSYFKILKTGIKMYIFLTIIMVDVENREYFFMQWFVWSVSLSSRRNINFGSSQKAVE
jgi:hypothetical protein